MVPNGRVSAPIVPMLHQNRLRTRVMLQKMNEFRPTISAMSDDTDPELQLTEYSLL
jgi:hypothetical protein